MFNLPLTLAYLDPGTGAIVLQILIAAVLTTGICFRKILVAPLLLFRAFFSQKQKAPVTEPAGK
jgi:hypothetical protein